MSARPAGSDAASPVLQLRTLYRLDGDGRITGTREPRSTPGPAFALIRGAAGCAWAVRADVDGEVAAELGALAREEPPAADLRAAPMHEARYRALVAGAVFAGPAFTFPRDLVWPDGVVAVEDERLLARHFRGWQPGELGAGRAPALAVVEDGHAVSVCCCARSSPEAAEAGLETVAPYRGRGHGPRVVAAWALAVRASGRIPLYSTAWENAASLAVARRLGLSAYACDWSVTP